VLKVAVNRRLADSQSARNRTLAVAFLAQDGGDLASLFLGQLAPG